MLLTKESNAWCLSLVVYSTEETVCFNVNNNSSLDCYMEVLWLKYISRGSVSGCTIKSSYIQSSYHSGMLKGRSNIVHFELKQYIDWIHAFSFFIKWVLFVRVRWLSPFFSFCLHKLSAIYLFDCSTIKGRIEKKNGFQKGLYACLHVWWRCVCSFVAASNVCLEIPYLLH